MKVLVSGANGFLGQRVVAAFLARGHAVRAIVRPNANLAKLGWDRRVEVFRADLRGGVDLVPAFEGVDALVHLATTMVGDDFTILSGTLVGTERLLEAMAKTAVQRLILCSSYSVYDWLRVRDVLSEDSPLPADVFASGAYAVAKTWQETLARRMVARKGWKLTILRPGFIWGRGNEDLACIGQRLGRLQLVLGFARVLPLTHVDNCADCFAHASEQVRSVGEVFNVVDDHDATAWRFAAARRDGRAEPGFLLSVPYRLARLCVGAVNLGSRLVFQGKGKLPSLFTPVRFELRFKPVRTNTKKLAEVLGWRPPHDFAACVERTWPRADGVAETRLEAT